MYASSQFKEGRVRNKRTKLWSKWRCGRAAINNIAFVIIEEKMPMAFSRLHCATHRETKNESPIQHSKHGPPIAIHFLYEYRKSLCFLLY